LPKPQRLARKKEAVLLWAYLSLGGIVVLAIFILWHLARRGRLIRERLGAPRDIRLPQLPELNGESVAPES
jgi:hypothetical protein